MRSLDTNNIRCIRLGRWLLLYFVIFVAINGLLVTPSLANYYGKIKTAIKFNRDDNDPKLMSQWVIDVLQDAQGFIWVATQTGLYRYDGYSSKPYIYSADNPNSLANSYVVSLFEDSEQRMWVGTHDGVLHLYQPELDRFLRFPFDQAHPKTPRSNSHIMDIFENKQGQLLVATLGAGVQIFDPKQQMFVSQLVYDANNPNSLSDDKVYSVIEDSQGMIWAGTRSGGLNRYDPATKSFTRFRHDATQANSLSHDRVDVVFEDSRRNIWVGTRGGGLNLFNRVSQNFIQFWHDSQNSRSLGSNQVFSIFEDLEGQIWIGTYKGGLNLFDPINREFKRHTHSPQMPLSIPDDDVFAIMQDHQGLIWLGTFGGGIVKFDPKGGMFGIVMHEPGNNNSLVDGEIHAIFKDSKDILWIGSNKGLQRVDESRGEFKFYSHQLDNNNSLSGVEVWAIAEDPKGGLWIGTRDAGLNYFDTDTETFVHYRHQAGVNSSLSDNYVKALHFDPYGRLWVGTQNGLNLFNAKSQSFKRFSHDVNDANTISHNVINDIFSDEQGQLWLTTNGGGFNLFVEKLNRFERYMYEPSNPNSVSSNTVYAITQDSKGIYWLGTMMGLNRFDLKTGRFELFTNKDGFYVNRIQSVLFDDNERLWAVGGGLTIFDPDSKKIVSRIGSEVKCSANQGASFKSKQGFLYFGTRGYCHFHPDDIMQKSDAPDIIFTDFLLENKKVPVSSEQLITPLSKTLNYIDEIVLTHEQNFFTLKFSALHFSEPLQNRYKYKLEGFNTQWIETDANNRYATYTNLSAGKYTFMLNASNNEGVWAQAPRTLSIVVQPAPWQSWWAYSIYTLVILVLVSSYAKMIRQSVMHEREETKRLESKVTERTEELERSNQSITALSEISAEISSTLELNKLLNIVYTRIKLLMDVDVFSIGLYEPENRQLNFKLAIEQGEYLPEYTIDMDEKDRPAVWCIENRCPMILNDFERDFTDLFGDLPIPVPKIGTQPESLMYWPLIVGEHISGVLTVQSYRKEAYNEHQQEMIQTLASTTAIALDNARAYREVADKNQTIMSTQQKLVESEKMASLGVLTAGVAHEINNPTNFVHVSAHNLTTDMKGFQQVLLDMVGDDAEDEVLDIFREQFGKLFSHVDLITTGTERIKQIVEDLSAFSQLDAQEKQSVNVVDCLLSTINLVQTKYLNQISFDTDFYPTQQIMGYPAQLNQVFMNLLVNACDAIRDRSRKEAAEGLMKALMVAGQITIGCQQRGQWIEVSIKDNGCGMDESTKNKLFEPFYTTKPTGEGTGLGLSISYGIVQKHNGEIVVESEVGVGTIFTILLPCDVEPD